MHGDTVLSWSATERLAARLAGAFVSARLGPGSKVACYLYNCAEYMQVVWAALQALA